MIINTCDLYYIGESVGLLELAATVMEMTGDATEKSRRPRGAETTFVARPLDKAMEISRLSHRARGVWAECLEFPTVTDD